MVLLHKNPGIPLIEPSSFRLISMLDTCGKLLESMVLNRFNDHIDETPVDKLRTSSVLEGETVLPTLLMGSWWPQIKLVGVLVRTGTCAFWSCSMWKTHLILLLGLVLTQPCRVYAPLFTWSRTSDLTYRTGVYWLVVSKCRWHVGFLRVQSSNRFCGKLCMTTFWDLPTISL